MKEEYIICPICKGKFKSLVTHLFYKHNLTTNDFRELYPDFRSLQIQKKHGKKLCSHCNNGKLYSPAGLGSHIAIKHKDVFKSNRVCEEGFKCPICGKIKVNFSQHIEMAHDIKWEDFIKQYNWTDLKTYVSQNHKDNLSKNKKKFYAETERGKELRREMSKKVSGDGNPAKLKHVRDKISKAAMNRILKNDSTLFVGIGIHCYYESYKFRSLQEFKLAFILLEHNMPFEYESEYMCYLDEIGNPHRYLMDFKINGVFYEIKVKNTIDNLESIKYKEAKKLFGKNIKLLIPEHY